MKNTPFTRFLDKHLGKSMCYLFSAFSKFMPRRKVKEVKSVLFIELFEMGAAIMAYPSLKYAINSKTKPKVYVLCTASVKESWELLDVIPREDIYAIDDKSLMRFGLSLLDNVWRLSKKNIDMIIDLELFLRVSSMISFMIRSKRKAGFHKYEMEGLYRGSFYDTRCAYNQNMHISKNFLALTKTALDQLNEYPNLKAEIRSDEIFLPKYKSDPKIRDSLKKRLAEKNPLIDNKSIVLLCPDVGPQLPMRNYPKEQYAEVVRQMLEQDSTLVVVLVGVKSDMPTCSFIKARNPSPRCINFCAETKSIRELVELSAMSKLFIGNDNGPAHFASLTNTKIIAAFSTDSPFMYGPLGDCVVIYSYFHCSPCISAWNHKYSMCKNNLCLKSIKPETITLFSFNHMAGKLKPRTINGTQGYIR